MEKETAVVIGIPRNPGFMEIMIQATGATTGTAEQAGMAIQGTGIRDSGRMIGMILTGHQDQAPGASIKEKALKVINALMKEYRKILMIA